MTIPPHLIAQIDQRYPDAREDVLGLVDYVRDAIEANGAPVAAAMLAAEVLAEFEGNAQQLAGMLGLAVVELALVTPDEEVADAT